MIMIMVKSNSKTNYDITNDNRVSEVGIENYETSNDNKQTECVRDDDKE